MSDTIIITIDEYAALVDIVNSGSVLWLAVNQGADPTQSMIMFREHCLKWIKENKRWYHDADSFSLMVETNGQN